jgi:uncharacterized protein (TIRG00374 family)
MKRQRVVIFIILASVLAALVYWQVSQWRRFDWETFSEETENVNWGLILLAVFCVWAADTLRAWRWAIFLRPVKKVAGITLVASQFIGFAGLALLGRPGELIRPYVIARRVGMPLSSQMAVWMVERIFDFGTVTTFLLADILFSKSLTTLPAYGAIRTAGFVLTAMVLLGVGVAFVLRRYGLQLGAWVERRLTPRFPAVATRMSRRIREFSEGLNTIHDLRSFILCALISALVWGGVAVSYRLVTYAYHDEEVSSLDFPQVVLLMFSSIAGGVLQLPVIGGGSQLATIATMKSENVFNISPELATSCGILLWLVTFMSVAPVGLLLARREHVSLTELAKEEEEAESAQIWGTGQRDDR